MTLTSLAWFVGQLGGVVLAVVAGRRIGRASGRTWKLVASVATAVMLFWPVMRLFPCSAINLIGAQRAMYIEITGIVLPAALLFAIAMRQVKTTGERRGLAALIAICCVYLAYHGQWMVGRDVPDLGRTRIKDGICRQSTDYTCVAASLVTLLEAYGYQTTETEMARLAHTTAREGTTDCRAMAALEEKLAGEPVDVHFESMDYERLKAVPKPCVVSMRWGYFVSHMVPVLSANDQWVYVGDPLAGKSRYQPSDFVRNWHKCGIYVVDHRKPTGTQP